MTEDLRDANTDSELALHAHTIGKPSVKPIQVDLEVSGKKLALDVDTGAAVSILSEKVFQQFFSEVKLKPSSLLLKTYTGERMQILGTLAVKVCYLSQGPFDLELVVVSGDGPCLMGRDWLQVIRLDWPSIAVVLQGASTRAVQGVLDNYPDVFAEGLGTIYPFKATLFVVKDAKPRFHRARPVPFALKSHVEEALDQLEADGALEKVTHSDWAAPIVTVPKRNGSIRLCGAYKVTVNPVLDVDKYPLPRPEDIFATLAGGKKFTTLNLSHAYNQLILDKESRKYVVVNTHCGLYHYTRLPFGIASVPALFQCVMDQILQGMEKVTCYLDDILITGTSDEEHLMNLSEVVQRLQNHGVRLNGGQC